MTRVYGAWLRFEGERLMADASGFAMQGVGLRLTWGKRRATEEARKSTPPLAPSVGNCARVKMVHDRVRKTVQLYTLLENNKTNR